MSDASHCLDCRLIDIVDLDWRRERLPHEDVPVEPSELPELDPDTTEVNPREEEYKWPDVALHQLLHLTEDIDSRVDQPFPRQQVQQTLQ